MEAYSVNSNLGFLFSFVKYLPLRVPWGFDEANELTHHNSTILSKLLLLLFGLACIGFGSLTIFFQDKERRASLLQYLILLQLIEAFFLHTPLVETTDTDRYSRELKKFWLNVSVISGILMMLGFRD